MNQQVKNKLKERCHRNGNAVFMAILLVSVLLLVSTAIGDLATREHIFASFSVKSQKAFYVADAGIECATFLDIGYGALHPPPATLFLMPSDNGGTVTAKLNTLGTFKCGNNLDIAPSVADSSAGAGGATTVFYVKYSSSDNNQPCSRVAVTKTPNGTGAITVIVSNGFDISNKLVSDCSPASDQTRQVQRALRVQY